MKSNGIKLNEVVSDSRNILCHQNIYKFGQTVQKGKSYNACVSYNRLDKAEHTTASEDGKMNK